MGRFNKTTLALLLSAAVAAGVAVSVGYRASVRHQICLSYSRQASALIDKEQVLFEEITPLLIAVYETPMMLPSLGRDIIQLKVKNDRNNKAMNDMAYAFAESCWPNEYDTWLSESRVKRDELSNARRRFTEAIEQIRQKGRVQEQMKEQEVDGEMAEAIQRRADRKRREACLRREKLDEGESSQCFD